MSDIFVTDREGIEHKIKISEDQTIMDVLRDSGLPIDATCGGEGTCATCHVHIDPDWYDKLPIISEGELNFIEAAMTYEPSCSRLSCQIRFSNILDGMSLIIADDE